MKRTAFIVTALLLFCLFSPTQAQAMWGCRPNNIQPPVTSNVVVWQLECFGFVRMDAWTNDSADHGVIHTEKWQGVDPAGRPTTIYISDKYREVWNYHIWLIANTVAEAYVWCEPIETVYLLRAMAGVATALHDPIHQATLGMDQYSGAVRIELALAQDGRCWYGRR